MKAKFFIFALCLLSLFSARSTVWAEDSEEVNVNLGAANGQTDFDAASQKERATSDAGYSAEELKVIEATRENHSFEAEVNKLMGIIINSLYSNSEIFLRELISNASDALDKIRYKSITDKSILDSNPDLNIKIKADPEAKTLTITDAGVGMKKEELVNNLGTIAQSGTANFIKSASNEADLGLIGQFGVGFYSAFLVADRVEVHSKSNDSDKQYVWDASSQTTYTVYEDPKQDLGRGTSIVLHIKESAMEYLEESRLRTLVSQYSEFIDFPIYLWSSHVEEVEPEVTADDDDDDMDVEDVDDDEEPELQKVTVWDYERVNDLKPLWARKPSEISDEDYNNFYKGFAEDTQDPLAHEHFSAEGDINFRGLLYIPSKPPAGLYDSVDKKTGLKLYVKRVFITDDFSEIIPRYLSFIKGIVDSDDLPLNVSREMLQKNRLLTAMKKKLIRKAIAMIQDIAKNDEEKYLEFFEKFGTSLKLGVLEDSTNKARLEKLLRFQSSATDDLTSFEAYVERMKEGQEQIYYFAAQDEKENMMKSPLLERLLSKGYEVLFMTDPIDEYVFQQGAGIDKFDGKDIVNVAKDGAVKLPEDEEEVEDENSIEELEKEDSWKALISYVKDTVGSTNINKVKLTDRLTSSPSVVSSSAYGWTGNMEKLAKAQALGSGDKSMHKFYKSMRTLELNPRHPVVLELKNRIVAGENSGQLVDITNLLFESALLSSGYELEDQPAFADRINNVLRLGLGLEVEYPEPAAPQEDFEEDVESLDFGYDEL